MRAQCGAPQLTDATGRYQFTGLAPALYQVEAVTPVDWAASGPISQRLLLQSGSAATASFGYQARGGVGGVIFVDLDGDAIQSFGESGLVGVAVQVLQENVLVAVTASNAGGLYQLMGLAPGIYTLRVVLPVGFAAVTPPEKVVVLNDGSAVSLGFGLQPLSNIAGVVYADLNGDGQRQLTEPGMGGVELSIYTAGPDGVFETEDDLFVVNTFSAGDGAYQLLNQAANSYSVHMTAPANYAPTTARSIVVNLAQAWMAVANFGLQVANTVAATTFEDLNGNGVQDLGEPPLANMPVMMESIGSALLATGDSPLTDSAESPAAGRQQSVVYTTTTNSMGFVVFRDVQPGAYVVRTAPPSDSYVAPRIAGYVTAPLNGTASEQFGFRPIGTVSGKIYNDLDGNGQQDAGELGLSGVTLTMRNASGQEQATITAVDGRYGFSGLPAGAYELTATPPASFAPTAANPVVVTLAATGVEAAASVNIGLVAAEAVSGRVFSDLNRNGLQDVGEPGVSGVLVMLSSGAPIRSVLSVADGLFVLAGVADGSYNAAITLPPNFTAISAQDVSVTVDGVMAATAHYAIRPNLPNRRPVIDAIPNQEFKVNDTVAIQVHATDADDVALTYAATGLPASLIIDPVTGLIHGLLGNSSAGIHQVTVTVSDAWGGSDQTSFTVTVAIPTSLDPGDEPHIFAVRVYVPMVVQMTTPENTVSLEVPMIETAPEPMAPSASESTEPPEESSPGLDEAKMDLFEEALAPPPAPDSAATFFVHLPSVMR
jgi:hypothetical protein